MNLAVSSLLVLLFIPVNAVQLMDKTESHNHDHAIFVDYKSPRAQFMDKIPVTMVTCDEGFELIMKKTNGMPACVKPSTAAILIERGWGVHVLPDYVSGNNNSELFNKSGPYEVITEEVNYFENYDGYLATPDAEEATSFPGIILIHENRGLNQNIKDMAEELASHGYVALAVDLFGVEAATTADEARQLSASYDPQKGLENMNAAVQFLKERGVQKIASIGWCFGGGQSLELALSNNEMDATIIYYGRLVTEPERLSTITWPVLGIFAGLDTGIPPERVHEFEDALNELGIQNEIHIYPNVNHAFANPSGERHAPEETRDAWEKTLTFLSDTLKES
jgi:carboxymethylenebutenolidase